MATSLFLALALAGVAALSALAVKPPRSPARAGSAPRGALDDCKAGLCGGMAHYEVAPGMRFYSTFNVPGLPKNKTAIAEDITFFIYANIFFNDGGVEQGRMNQFVPQLMLGQPLSGSTGPPDYDPIWSTELTWVFAAQYFMEIYDNSTAKAAAGPKFPCAEGDVLYTEFALDADAVTGEWIWKQTMGVVNDTSRISTLVIAQPYMGLLVSNGTSSWKEAAYAHAYYNTCWELYGIAPYGLTHYPSSASVYDIRTILGPSQAARPFPWQSEWSSVEFATCPGHPSSTFSELHNETQQDVTQLVFFGRGA